ncbi:TPA: outer membrane protein [Providencia alcalifaciens]|uniref:outer membrane protein n=1 Tax=Providencia TaxID=586 RepID=UPI00234A4A7E|nr:outer membrane beta-barrel protein [Providencia sp. PROV033]
MKSIFIITCGLFTSLAVANNNNGLYLSGKIGDSIVNFHNSKVITSSPSGNGPEYHDKNENDSVFSGSISLGYDFHEKFNISARSELELSMREKAETQYHAYGPDEFGISANIKNNARVNTFMFNNYYDFKNQTSFTPYISIGLGLARVDYNRVLSTTIYTPTDVLNSSKTSTINNFAWALGAGTQYTINNNLALDVSYRFLDAGKYQISETDLAGNKDKTETNIRTHDIMLGLVYRF